MKLLLLSIATVGFFSTSVFANEITYDGAEAQSLYMSLVALQVQNPELVQNGGGSGNGSGGWTQISLWTEGKQDQLSCTKTEYRSGKQAYTCSIRKK